MVHDKGNEVIEERFESLLSWYQLELEISMKGSDLIFLFTYCTYYYLTCWIIYRFSWFNKKNATINLIGKNDNKCFQYAATVALIYEKIGKIFEE